MPADLPQNPPALVQKAESAGPRVRVVYAEPPAGHPLHALRALCNNHEGLPGTHPIDAVYGRPTPTTVTHRGRVMVDESGTYRVVVEKDGTWIEAKGAKVMVDGVELGADYSGRRWVSEKPASK